MPIAASTQPLLCPEREHTLLPICMAPCIRPHMSKMLMRIILAMRALSVLHRANIVGMAAGQDVVHPTLQAFEAAPSLPVHDLMMVVAKSACTNGASTRTRHSATATIFMPLMLVVWLVQDGSVKVWRF